ncbi:MAG: hypothetical protein K940chlam9_00921 [Chlamydiae bacterium]|nr:hypothetical protein [Chlamydiota bacterium]
MLKTMEPRVHLFGHVKTGMGERSLTWKFASSLAPLAEVETFDILEWMNEEEYTSLAELNYSLAEGGHALLEEIGAPFSLPKADLNLVLSWGTSLAALFGKGIQKSAPTIAKLYVHHPDERIFPKLYEPAALCLTESPLAFSRALSHGFLPEKLLYIPHTYPQVCETLVPNRTYVDRLAASQGKQVSKDAVVVGCVGRLVYGKNTEFAIETVRRLVEREKKVVLVVKGDFPEESLAPKYEEDLKEMLTTYSQEAWLLWDQDSSPFPEVVEEYMSFDLLLHPSGAEGGSHVVVEALGLGKPVLLLDCSTNPSLFSGLATFVKTEKEPIAAPLPFYRPDLEDLIDKLEKALEDPKIPNKRQVEERFHPEVAASRLPLLFSRDKERLLSLQKHDEKLYGM